ncbi:MAG: ABC-2 type transport system permease protein [Myxococcota bacterium]|jgi:ABC-2 type transport system permease protein
MTGAEMKGAKVKGAKANPGNHAPGVGGHAEGTVFDIGYQRYDGPRHGRHRARLAVFKDGIRIALGLGRGGRAKILPWLFIALLVGIGFIMALVAGAALLLGGPDAVEQLPSHSDFYGICSIFFFVFAAVVAPELLSPDRRDGVINLYLVRPLTGGDYIVARWLAFLVVSLAVAWLPQFVLMIGLVMGNPDPVEYLKANWTDAPKILASGAAFAAYTTTLAMLVAGYTKRRAYASVFLVGLFVVTTPFTAGLSTEIEGAAGQWISMFNLSNIPVHVNDWIFGEVSNITSVAPARELGTWVLVGWYVLWVVIPGGVLWNRYQRLTP